MYNIDLHTHTNFSDGVLTPIELIEKAKLINSISGIAITDHDSVEALLTISNINLDSFILIPGVELGCYHNNEEVHILGYFIDIKSESLLQTLIKLRNARWDRGVKILEALSSLGIELPIESILNEAREIGFIGRATIARDMVKYGYVQTIKEAFELYLDTDKPAYIKRWTLGIKEAIELIKANNGIPILAHPGLLKDKSIIDLCISLGISGLECTHSKHTTQVTNELIAKANYNGLIITGGSDFHNHEDKLGKYFIDIESIKAFKEKLNG